MENNSNAPKINILYIIRVILGYWPLYMLSCFIFLSFAVLYLRYSARTYSVSARILIKTDRMRTRSSDTYVNVNDLMNQEKNLSNEMSYFRSSPLVKEVINDMKLFISYYYQEDKIPMGLTFGLNNIYKSSPFLVVINKESYQPLGVLIYIRILDDNNFIIYAENEETYLYNFDLEEASTSKYYFKISGTYKFGDVIENKHCSFKILLNSNYDPQRYQGKDLYFRFNSPLNLAYRFQESLDVNSNFYQSSIATLTFEGENLELAREFLENIINKYIEKNLEKKNYDASNTINYIEEQLASISGDLGQTERQLQNFRNTREVMNIDDKFRELLAQIQELEAFRDELQSQIQDLTRLREYFLENQNSQTFIAPTFSGMSDETLAALIQELTTLSRERQNLISTNQLKNPRIKTLDASMNSIKKVIIDNITFSISSIQSDLNETNRKLTEFSAEYSRLPQTQRQLLELEREFNINDEVYTTLLNRRIQAKIIQASNRPDVEIIEPVRYNMVTSPSVKKIGVIYLFLGFFFPTVYIVIVNFLSPKIKTKDELKNFTKLTSIGDIPHNDKSKFQNVITNSPSSPIVERFHSIRSNLHYYLLGEKNKTILVTSTLPSEGKSFTSLNLALSFASTNNRTLLVNFDLRKNSKTLAELRMNALIGLDLYLINGASLEDIIYETPYPNLDFMHNGNIPPDPVALITSPRMEELFESLKSEYDYIVIDTPPFGMVTDAFLLMQYADIKLYVSRIGTVTKKALKQSMEDIMTKKIENIYLIRNDLSKLDKTYADKYGYGDKKRKGLARIFNLRKR